MSERKVSREELKAKFLELQKTAQSVEWLVESTHKRVLGLPVGAELSVDVDQIDDAAKLVDGLYNLALNIHNQIALEVESGK